MKTTFKYHQKIAENTYSFFFEPNDHVRYIAGQFTEIKLPHPNVDERGDKRYFTLSSSPKDSLLSITTKIYDKRSSFKNALYNLEPGTEVNLASPMGDFVLPKDASIPLMFVAGGIGCTPYHSIIKFLKDTGEKRDIQLLYGAKELDEVAFQELFASYLGEDFQISLDRLNKDIILQTIKNPDKRHIYLSGPEPMVEKLDKDIKEASFSPQRLHTDFFPGYTSV